MAKKRLTRYVFNPGVAGTGNLVLPGRVEASQFLLITNATRGSVLYNFADTQNRGANSVIFDAGASTITNTQFAGETTLVFNSNTAGQSSSDSLTIFVEGDETVTRPYDFGMDAMYRMRVATPSSLIDADFEYGLQPTKWQQYQTVRNYPSVFENIGTDLTPSTITTNAGIPNSIITVTLNGHGLAAGDPFTISALNSDRRGYARAEGTFLVQANTGVNTFTYVAKGQVGTASGQSLQTSQTQVRRAGFYTGATIAVANLYSDGTANSLVKVSFTSPPGFVPSMPFMVNIAGAGATTIANAAGPFYTNAVLSTTEISYIARGTVPVGNVIAWGNVSVSFYARPDGYFTHRPGDGGVILGTGVPTFGSQVARQSKKYFRYQPAKGLFFSTGGLVAPNFDIKNISANNTSIGSNITVETDEVEHLMQANATVLIEGINTSGYDGEYLVDQVLDEITFSIKATNVLGGIAPEVAAQPKVYLKNWHGASVRLGPADDQNGVFWEYDGQTLNVVRRSSTFQTAGTVSVIPDSNTVTGAGTKFTQQLEVGQRVVIRGMTHRVIGITSDTTMFVAPDYRGNSSAGGIKMYLIQEQRVPQTDFNLDRLDGTGPSGFLFLAYKMQMYGIQFTWYGAGSIDYMIRGTDGSWVFAHKIKNNNVNNEAFMRTGNLPLRYEIINEGGGVVSKITGAMTAGSPANGSNFSVENGTFFPNAGVVYIDNELIAYNGKVGNTFLNITRGATLRIFVGGQLRTFYAGPAANHNIRSGCELLSCLASPTITHWGSAYVMDGGFDTDRGYIFSYQENNITVTNTEQTLFALRLAPSVSNSITGDLGDRELLNRAQILLEGLEVTTANTTAQTSIVVKAILNPSNFDSGSTSYSTLNTPALGSQPSFSQVSATPAFTGSSAFAVPGEQVFSYIAAPGQLNTLSLRDFKELTQSALGGRGVFPNGPDVLCINVVTTTATPINGVNVILRWTEAQA